MKSSMLAQPKTFPNHEALPAGHDRSGFEIIDPRFKDFILEGSKVTHHWQGAEWSEGAVYLPKTQVVVWSDIPNNRMLQFDPRTNETTIFREPSNFTNGNCTDNEGRLITATHLTHCLSRTEHDGQVTLLVDRYQRNRLNSPNDVVVKSDDSIWFTDPPYGILSDREGETRESEQSGNHVYRFCPDSAELTIVVDTLDRPNGLAFSPDESELYISDTGSPSRMYAFDVNSDGSTLTNKRDFIKVSPGVSDGFRCDTEGNIWTSAADGIQCFSSKGELLGKVRVPETRCANCCFGGPEGDILYIAGDTSLYSVKLAAKGAQYSK